MSGSGGGVAASGGGSSSGQQNPTSTAAGTKRPAPPDDPPEGGRQLRSSKKSGTGTAKPPPAPPPVPRREIVPTTVDHNTSLAKLSSATFSPSVDANGTPTLASDSDLLAGEGFSSALDDLQHPSQNTDKNIEHFIFNLPLNGKKYTPKLVLKELGRGDKSYTRWVFTCIDSAKNVLYFGTERTTVYSRAEALQIAQGLVDILERLPSHMSPDCITTASYVKPNHLGWFVHFLLRAAFSHANAAATSVNVLRASAPAYAVKKKSTVVSILVHTLDPSTLEPYKTHFQLSSGHVTDDYVEDIPDGAMEFTYDRGMTWHGKDFVEPDDNDQLNFPTTVPAGGDPNVRKRFKLLERLGRRILYELHGKIMDKDTTKSRIERIIQLHGGQAQTRVGLLGTGTKIWYFNRHRNERRLEIIPSDSARATGFKPPVHIGLPTLDSSWITKIVDRMDEVYASTGSLDKAWIEGGTVASTIVEAIKDGDQAPSFCDCTSEYERNTESHACSRCGHSCLCSSRRPDSTTNLPICAKCHLRQSIAIARGPSKRRKPFLETLMRKRLLPRMSYEAGKAGLSRREESYLQNKADSKAWIKSTVAKMPSGFQWQSQATKQIYTIDPQSSGHGQLGRKFDDASVDAMGPISINHKTYFVHCPDNYWLIEQCLNFAKNIQIPAFLDLIGNNVRFYLQDPAGISTEQIRKWERVVIGKANLAHKIRIRFAYVLRTRLAQPASAKKLALDLEEVFSGKMRRQESTPKNVLPLFKNLLPLKFSPAELDRLQRRSRELQNFYGVNLVELNGCTYFLHEKTMPEDWSWAMCLALCKSRFERMRDWCNKKGTTCETPQTIFIFCVLVACVRKCVILLNDPLADLKRRQKKLFEELLSLPLALLPCHGLRFALGHIDHNRSMDTGIDVDTWDFDESKCNVIMETCTTNYLKQNYPNTVYPRLVNIVSLIDIRGTPAFDDSIELTDRDDDDAMAFPPDAADLLDMQEGEDIMRADNKDDDDEEEEEDVEEEDDSDDEEGDAGGEGGKSAQD